MGLISNKAGKKKSAISILLTMVVIFGLVIAGPVSAIRLQLKTDKAVYQNNDRTVKILASVDIERNELIPIEDLTLRINDDFLVCNFNVDGSESCPNVTITLLNPGVIEEGQLRGKGFGFENPGDEPSQETTDFGFGYGFDDQRRRSGFRGELLYEIRWSISPGDTPNGRYEAELEAFAEENGEQFTYVTKRSKKFNIKLSPNQKFKTEHKVEVKADDGMITLLGDDTLFTREDASFSTKLTYVKKGSEEKIGGRTALTAYAEQADGSKIQFQVQMTDHDPINFESDDIEVQGTAQVRYQKNTPGDDVIRVREMISDVVIKIEGGMVLMSSTDPDMPFEIELTIERFDFD